ncbi:MAG: dihydrofolate reductase family protein [Candidatus Dormibacteria bacterium]
MGRLTYAITASLDGYVADARQNFDWAEPDPEVHDFYNQLLRSTATHLYGRRMYQVMATWDHLPTPRAPDYVTEFAELWRRAEKVVYSRSLQGVSTTRTRLEPEFRPAAIAQLKAKTEGDLSVGGPVLASQALAAGLVDQLCLVQAPVVVGGGRPWLEPGLWLELKLLDQRRFGNGMVALRYQVRGTQPASPAQPSDSTPGGDR